jgi:hypothetical protein
MHFQPMAKFKAMRNRRDWLIRQFAIGAEFGRFNTIMRFTNFGFECSVISIREISTNLWQCTELSSWLRYWVQLLWNNLPIMLINMTNICS